MSKIVASILVPTYNSEKFIRSTIESILNQNFDKRAYEAIFVDDGSKDKTVEILKTYQSKFPNLKIITQENQGPSVAYTRLLEEARGDFLFLMSHDCVAESYWLKEVLQEFEKDPQVALVQGKLLPTKPIDLPVFHCNTFTSFQVTFDTAEVAYRSSAVDKIGRYFRADFSTNGHDADMGWRLIEAGYKTVWLDKVLMHHDVLPRKFLADIKNYYLMQYLPKLLKIHPGMRKYLPHHYLWASIFKYAFAAGVLGSFLLLIFGLPLLALGLLVFTFLFSIYRVFKNTKDFNLAFSKKLFILVPHRIICETLLGFFLLYGTIKYRSLVI